jgi:hypothetical protein
MALQYAVAQKEYVIKASSGAITEPSYGSWLAAYAIYLGATKPNGTWLQTICNQLGVTEPVNGSWVQALALYYGITDVTGYGNWWLALADMGVTPPVVDIWENITNLWEDETIVWEI